MNAHPTYLAGTYTVPAGASVDINRVGNFVTCLAAPAPFRIRIGTAPETDFEKGLSFQSETVFESVTLINPTGEAMEIQVGIGKGGVRDSRLIIAENSLEVRGQGSGGEIMTQERDKAVTSLDFSDFLPKDPNAYGQGDGVQFYSVNSPQPGVVNFGLWDGVSPNLKPFLYIAPKPGRIRLELLVLGHNKATSGNIHILNEIRTGTQTVNNFHYALVDAGSSATAITLEGIGGWRINNNLKSGTLDDTKFSIRIKEFAYV